MVIPGHSSTIAAISITASSIATTSETIVVVRHFRILLNKRRIYLLDETAGIAKLHLTITETVFRTRENTMFLGSRNGNIKQTSLLLQLTERGDNGTWEDVLLQTYHKDRRELKSLGGMNGHERHTGLVVIALAVEIGQQRNALQIIRKISLLLTSLLATFLHKTLHSSQQLFQVLLTGQILRITASRFINIGTNTTLLDDGVAQVEGVHARRLLHKTADHQPETLQLGKRSLVDSQTIMLGRGNNLPEAHMIVERTGSNLCHGRIADSSSRIVDNTLESLLVVGICHKTEISDDILDLLALEEAESTIDAIRNALFSELFLEASALGIGTVENGEIAVLAIVLTLDALDLATHDQGLFLVAVGWFVDQALSLVVLAVNVLRNLIAVVLDQAVCRLHNALRAAIVLLQFEESGFLEPALKTENIVDIGATKTIDALGVVAHGTNPLLLLAQLHHDAHLGVVGVLILVNQEEVEPVGVFLPDVLMLLKELEGKSQQIVEIHGVGLLATLHIRNENFSHTWHFGTLVGLIQFLVAGIVLRTHQVVLSHRNAAVDGGRLVDLLVESHLLDDGLDERARVALIVDGKVVGETYVLSLGSENARENAVESSHIEMLRQFLSHEFADAFFHLSCSLVGKGERHDAPGFHSLLQEVSDLIGKHTGLSRTCTGNHKRRSVNIFHSLALRFVQVVQ